MESKLDNWTERSDCQQNTAMESNSSGHQTISQTKSYRSNWVN